MKTLGFLVAFALFLLAIFQPWTYNYHGYDEATLSIAGGEITFELVDQVRKNNKNSYCLLSVFEIKDKPSEPVAITIDRIGTKSLAELRTHISNSGETKSVDNSGKYPSFFQPPGISKLVFPTDESLDVIGSILYKGVTHPFHITLQLKHWEKSREVIRFCV